MNDILYFIRGGEYMGITYLSYTYTCRIALKYVDGIRSFRIIKVL